MIAGHTFSRRRLLTLLAAAGIVRPTASAGAPAVLTKPIPATGEALPVVGMGSWITFNVGGDAELRAARTEVLRAFFAAGGTLIDSSPMYGSSEEVIGHCLKQVPDRPALFAATKVWTMTAFMGRRQMEESERLWGVRPFDLLQIHNLLDWETHLETLLEWKSAGRVRYIGITTSHGRRHDEMEAIMASKAIDFVQLTYNIRDREAEDRLLPLAAERGMAVLANRPFQGGALFDDVAGRPLPDWAAEIGCANWAQVFLKFAVSHPAVTGAIPATSRVDHMQENMGAQTGPLPDAGFRARMIADIENA